MPFVKKLIFILGWICLLNWFAICVGFVKIGFYGKGFGES